MEGERHEMKRLEELTEKEFEIVLKYRQLVPEYQEQLHDIVDMLFMKHRKRTAADSGLRIVK